MSDSAMKHTSGVITKTITSIPKEKRPSKIVSTVLGAGIFYLGWQVMPANASIPSWVGYVTAAYGGVMACGDYVKAPWRIIIAAARDVINLVSAFVRAKRGEAVPPDESNEP